ncbi:MAG: sulfotransferase [Gallionella sp.]
MNTAKNPSPNDLNQLVALYNSRRYAELESMAGAMVKRFPASGFAWKLLGAAQQMQGKNALKAFSKTAKLLPSEPDAHFNLGVAQKSLGLFNEAAVSYRRALKLNPKYAEAHSNLGNVLKELGQLDEVVASYLCALQIKPNDALTHNSLGTVLKALEDFEGAADSYRRAIELRPKYIEAYTNLGNLLKDFEQFSDAIDNYQQALKIDPTCDDALLGIAHINVVNGKLEEAANTAEQAIALKPNNLNARILLANVSKAKVGDQNLAALVAADESRKSGSFRIPDAQTISLHFALGKSFDDLGEPDRAFPHFLEGCKMKRAAIKYDAEQPKQRVNDVIRVFDQTTIARLGGSGSLSNVPIFVLGMPRSGTTLTEQIIASHPDVFGAGELPELPVIAKRRIKSKYFPENILAIDKSTLSEWGNDYVAGVHQREPDALHITDKRPENFWYVGLIHLMLPNAKIIHVSRNPVDTCLSCFTKLASRGLEESYDLAELGQYYRGYVKLMDYWRTLLPAHSFLDVQYEDIVADKELQARRIIDFCDMEWNEACLDFHKLKRSVSTASMTQVRKPIYQSSVERWRAYEKHLGPLLDALGDLVPNKAGSN